MFSINKDDYIEMKVAITKEDYNNLKELEAVCTKEDINLKLELEYKLSQVSHEAEAQALTEKDFRSSCMKEYIYYSQGRPVSYLGICNFGGNVYELNGMTHPDFRNKGIFRRLYEHAFTECRLANKKSLLLLTDGNSPSGNSFIKSVGGVLSFSEYRMELLAGEYAARNNDLDNGLSQVVLVEAQPGDISLLHECDKLLFGDEENEEEAEYISSIDNSYLIKKEDITIGKIKIDFSENAGFIYGFGVLPDYRGLGYGKAAIGEALKEIFSRGLEKAALDVAAANDRALYIYTGNGFREVSVMRYYEVKVM
ncbi:GNAT family N-acetyltransferase [Clostridium sp. KNHs205]|uniref:GNAT family N-acetyltransferase n=1 Tax=Clostridium sp. KNHs205 TaxID=1449050 RepID=UPI0006901C25|nr:GNAT family N-acetyltransferase [Clostridium sp. KNHs205]